MKYIISFLLLISSAQANDLKLCHEFISSGENYKYAHTNKHCLTAAKTGDFAAQYQVGMSFGFSGDKELEEKYYRLSANQGGKAAYLALGHLLRDKNEKEAIYWYELYANTKTEGYGYAASILSKLYSGENNQEKAEYWKAVCMKSPYNANC